MRANIVVVLPPSLDDDLGLGSRPEPFKAQALVAELAVEAFTGTILPGLAEMLKGAPAARQDMPAFTAATTRARRSRSRGFAMHAGPLAQHPS